VSNYLKVAKREQVIALIRLGWADRRIAREVGVNRCTVAKYREEVAPKPAKVFPGSSGGEATGSGESEQGDSSKPAKVFPGSGADAAVAAVRPRSRSLVEQYRETVLEWVRKDLTAQRIWQDLVAEFGYGGSYESVKRFVRKLVPERRAVGVMLSPPGEEAQVDFFQGPPTLDGNGQWRRPWCFRMTLCCSRHGYEEAVWDQKLETFLRLHERAFHALGGVPKVIRHDNLKAAVVRACLYDPDVHPVYAAFAAHWGFTSLPTQPAHPEENGKQERAGGYVKDNALKGRRFDDLASLNAYLRRWNETIARLRIHGTTRRQVWQHYLETDRLALQPVAAEVFALFRHGERTVHADGHVEVDGAFYPVATNLLGARVRVRWDERLVRVFHGEQLVAMHTRVAAGCFARLPGTPESPTSTQRAVLDRLLARCSQIGPDLRAWAEAAHAERGVRCLRLVQGVLTLLRKYPKEQVLSVARTACERRLYRYKDFTRLLEQRALQAVLPTLVAEHELIRPTSAYALEDLL